MIRAPGYHWCAKWVTFAADVCGYHSRRGRDVGSCATIVDLEDTTTQVLRSTTDGKFGSSVISRAIAPAKSEKVGNPRKKGDKPMCS